MPDPKAPTGWPPGLLQDDSRDLSRALAGKPDAMRHAREAVAAMASPDEQWRTRLWELIDNYRRGTDWPLSCRDQIKRHLTQHPATTAIERLQAENQALRADAERYRWLREHKCNSLSLSRDDDHACNYMTAAAWIDEHPEDFDDASTNEVEQMKSTNTIWRLQIYPHTPVGFNVWNGATPDAAIDAAMKDHP